MQRAQSPHYDLVNVWLYKHSDCLTVRLNLYCNSDWGQITRDFNSINPKVNVSTLSDSGVMINIHSVAFTIYAVLEGPTAMPVKSCMHVNERLSCHSLGLRVCS